MDFFFRQDSIKEYSFDIVLFEAPVKRSCQVENNVKRIYSNWDRLGNIATGINYIQLIKKQVTKSLQSGYQGITHTDVDTSMLVWRIADKAGELELQSMVPDRDVKSIARPYSQSGTRNSRHHHWQRLAKKSPIYSKTGHSNSTPKSIALFFLPPAVPR